MKDLFCVLSIEATATDDAAAGAEDDDEDGGVECSALSFATSAVRVSNSDSVAGVTKLLNVVGPGATFVVVVVVERFGDGHTSAELDGCSKAERSSCDGDVRTVDWCMLLCSWLVVRSDAAATVDTDDTGVELDAADVDTTDDGVASGLDDDAATTAAAGVAITVVAGDETFDG